MRDWVGPKECAAMLGIGYSTLRQWNVEGRGPVFFQYRGKKNVFRRYRRADVEAFLAECRRT